MTMNLEAAQRYNRHDPVRESGIGLRSFHYQDLLVMQPDIGWIEVHPENYFGGGQHRHYLEQARSHYPLSFHGVGLSLGSDQPVSTSHIKALKELVDIYEPFHVSDHASWSASGNAHLNDLLPLPYTQESCARLAENVQQVQDALGRQMLVENPSTYMAFKHNDMSEAEFMNEIARKTGCCLLLDINNIYVQSYNHGFDAYQYIDDIRGEYVAEMHLAGHIKREFEGGGALLVDTHNQYVCQEVWDLYRHAVTKFGAVPTLIEWDADLPSLAELAGEAQKAQCIVDAYKQEQLNAAE